MRTTKKGEEMKMKLFGIIVLSVCLSFIFIIGYTTYKITDKTLHQFDAKCEKEYGKNSYIIYECGTWGKYCCQAKPDNPLEHLPINTLQISGTLNTNNTLKINNITFGEK